MAQIVFAAGVPHLGAILTGIQHAGVQGERVDRVYAGLFDDLHAARPDALIIFGSDHFKSFFFNLVPRFTIGIGEACAAWDEGVIPRDQVDSFRVPVHQSLAREILDRLVERGFDLASSEELRLDHSFCAPIERLTPAHEIPIVPIVINVAIPPRPSFRRCYELGQAIGRVIGERPGDERIAVLGTGGLSHSVGSPDYGHINASMDQDFMRLLAAGRVEEILEGWSPEWVAEAGGNGMNEIRMWLAMAGVVGGAPGEVLLYEEMPAWNCGVGFLRVDAQPVGATA
jgi:hypothetical protein